MLIVPPSGQEVKSTVVSEVAQQVVNSVTGVPEELYDNISSSQCQWSSQQWSVTWSGGTFSVELVSRAVRMWK